MCGKLEEFPLDQRTLYFDSYVNTVLSTYNHPKFYLIYQLVDYCYNTTLLEPNSSFTIRPNNLALRCHFKIHLPYGNRIKLNIQVGRSSSSSTNSAPLMRGISLSKSTQQQPNEDDRAYLSTSDDFLITPTDFYPPGQAFCDDVVIEIMTRHNGQWRQCVRKSEAHTNVVYSLTTADNVLMIRITKSNQRNDIWMSSRSVDDDSLYAAIAVDYSAEPIESIVSQCAFGSISVGRFCVWPVNELRLWSEAEESCKSFGGHLASIKSDYEQTLIDEMLMNRWGWMEQKLDLNSHFQHSLQSAL